MTHHENAPRRSEGEGGSALIRNAGPVFSRAGKLVLSESFNAFEPVGTDAPIEDGDYIETWRVWDCCEGAWADIDLALHRFEMYDLVVRRSSEGVCVWRGALDQHTRIVASRDPGECRERCWQWARVGPDAETGSGSARDRRNITAPIY